MTSKKGFRLCKARMMVDLKAMEHPRMMITSTPRHRTFHARDLLPAVFSKVP